MTITIQGPGPTQDPEFSRNLEINQMIQLPLGGRYRIKLNQWETLLIDVNCEDQTQSFTLVSKAEQSLK